MITSEFPLPDGAYFASDNTYLTGMGTVLHAVHDRSLCEGRRHCVIHNPSDHSMRGFRTHWRADRRLMERMCPHGIGHPDPDDLAWHLSEHRDWQGVHGCDGCCR